MDQISEIKFLPWRGPGGEIKNGKKTTVVLFDDRLEYVRKFTQEVVIQFIKDDEPGEVKTSENFCDEEGVIGKDFISCINKYIETDYKKETGDPYNIHKLDIIFDGTIQTFTFELEEDKNELYKLIYNWKYERRNK